MYVCPPIKVFFISSLALSLDGAAIAMMYWWFLATKYDKNIFFSSKEREQWLPDRPHAGDDLPDGHCRLRSLQPRRDRPRLGEGDHVRETDGRRGKVTFYWTSTSIVVAGGARPSFGSTGTLHRYFLGRQPPSASRGADRKKSQCTTTFLLSIAKTIRRKTRLETFPLSVKKPIYLNLHVLCVMTFIQVKKDKFFCNFFNSKFPTLLFSEKKNLQSFPSSPRPPLLPGPLPTAMQYQGKVAKKKLFSNLLNVSSFPLVYFFQTATQISCHSYSNIRVWRISSFPIIKKYTTASTPSE